MSTTTRAKKEKKALEPQPAETSPGNPAETNGHGAPKPEAPPDPARKPIRMLSYQIGHDTYVQASIWEREVQGKNGLPNWTTYDVSLRKRYRGASGEWKSLYLFHGSELFAVVHALQAAACVIVEMRSADVPF